MFHFNPGHELDQDYYLDVGRYTPGAKAWHAEDHYLDLVVRTGAGVELSDVDELLTAVRHGLLTPEDGEQAVQTAVAAIDGLSRHDYDLDRWLARQRHGTELARTSRPNSTSGRVTVGFVTSMIL